ncbi:nucleotidyltransferase family protein [Marinobacter sp. chi1]|uniref:Nucleotidyltransferase family protein n=1 Tax=Marinobacter suaedae TaxID=3057675 RepID=A0ABT8W343_9GAMM|nr:nucleotidyltransferase family protein [Marinobacter sp. chi1]MDO3722649.1 nucleotidyltransferase family protein [Marinobacter sp. chi1]
MSSVPIKPSIPVIVLAAGASSRFGRSKMLLTMPDGQGTLLDRAIELARQLSSDVRVVHGAGYPLMRFRCRQQPGGWVRSPHWQAGLAASLQAGLLSVGPQAKGVFVLLADQPLLNESALGALGHAARALPDVPIAADYDGRPGVPAYLPRWLWPDVMALEGDRGAGQLLAAAGATNVEMPGVHEDVDTVDDWRLIRFRLSRTAQTAR